MHAGCPGNQSHIGSIVDDDSGIGRRERQEYAPPDARQFARAGLLIADLNEPRRRRRTASAANRTGSPIDASAMAYSRGSELHAISTARARRSCNVFEELRVDVAAAEVGVAKDLLMEGNGGLHAFEDEHVERALHSPDRFIASRSVNDQLRDQRVVVRRDHVLRISSGIDADAGAAWSMPGCDLSRRRLVGNGIFGVDAAFECVAANLDIALPVRQPLASRRSGSGHERCRCRSPSSVTGCST